MAHCRLRHHVTFGKNNADVLRDELSDAPELPDKIWFFAVDEIVHELHNADEDGFAFKQANTRIPTMLVPSVVGDGTGTETARDRYYEHQAQPFMMDIARAEMEREAAERRAAFERVYPPAVMEEEAAADREYEEWTREHGLEDTEFRPSNEAAFQRCLLRDNLRAGYEEDREAASKRLRELRAARQVELEAEEEPDDPSHLELELPQEALEPVAPAEAAA
jgi:hypothetical protein